MSFQETLRLHVFNAGLEVIIGCAIDWEVTHSFWLTVGAGVLVAVFTKSWSKEKK